MTIQSLMHEYGFEIDDIRWYLSVEFALRLVSFQDEPEDLTQFIWSGKLENELHDMEETFLSELQDKLDRGLTDEHRIREIFREIEREKRRRLRR